MPEDNNGRRILITRQFDTQDILGYIQLRPGVTIMPGMQHIAFSFLLSDDTPDASKGARLKGAALVSTPAVASTWEARFDAEFYEGVYGLAESDSEFYEQAEQVKAFIRKLLQEVSHGL